MEGDVTKRLDSMKASIEKSMTEFQEEERAKASALKEKLEQDAQEAKLKLMLQGNVTAASLIPDSPFIPPLEMKLSGVPQVEEIEVVVTDPMALIKAVVDGTVPSKGMVGQKMFDLLEIRVSVLKEMRKSMGENFAPPGVQFNKRTSFRPRTVVDKKHQEDMLN